MCFSPQAGGGPCAKLKMLSPWMIRGWKAVAMAEREAADRFF